MAATVSETHGSSSCVLKVSRELKTSCMDCEDLRIVGFVDGRFVRSDWVLEVAGGILGEPRSRNTAKTRKKRIPDLIAVMILFTVPCSCLLVQLIMRNPDSLNWRGVASA